MLTCFNGKTNFVFQRILNFFVKENSKILDLTYGRGLSWEGLQKEYKIIKLDKRKLGEDILVTDFNDYLQNKENSSFDCIYFDPPYYFKEKIRNFDIKNQLFSNEQEVFWTEDDFNKSLITLKKEVPRFLKIGGVIIIKMMDGYIGKEYYPNTFKVFNSLIGVMKPLGIFVCPIQKKDSFGFVRINHINYIVFKKVENKNEL